MDSIYSVILTFILNKIQTSLTKTQFPQVLFYNLHTHIQVLIKKSMKLEYGGVFFSYFGMFRYS